MVLVVALVFAIATRVGLAVWSFTLAAGIGSGYVVASFVAFGIDDRQGHGVSPT